MKVLVIGGTGPTGHCLVRDLVQRGWQVTMLHSGQHEIPETPAAVEHLHADPYDGDAMVTVLGARTFDLCLAMYGRLRAIAALLVGRVGRFISIGGAPAYRGYMNPFAFEPAGLPVPTDEEAPLVDDERLDSKGYRIVRTEQAVFEHWPDATHFRYPFVYGPYQMVPREWCIVRRIRDRRPFIILPDAGLALHSFGYCENLAHAVMLAVDQPKIAGGEIYNCADEQVLSLAQVVEIIAAALEHSLEIVSMPAELAVPAKPLMMQPVNTHRVLDIGKLRRQLGYRDRVTAADGLARTAHWLLEHPPEPGGMEESVLQDPFDYAAEDALVAAWRELCRQLPVPRFSTEPGIGLAYSGPGGRARSRAVFDE